MPDTNQSFGEALAETDRVSNIAWVISNGSDTKWRYWRVEPNDTAFCGPDWTDDRTQACHFARRKDAETWAHDDEDAAFIRPVALVDDEAVKFLVSGEMQRLITLCSQLGQENAKLRENANLIIESRQFDPARASAAQELCMKVDRVMQADPLVWAVGDLLPLIQQCGTFISFYAPEPIHAGQLANAPTDPDSPDALKGAFCLPVDKLSPAEVLNLFRAFILRNVTQWTMGAGDHHHPIWEHVAVNAEGVDPVNGPAWAYIQPLNRKKLNQLEFDYEQSREVREAEARGE